MKTLSARHCVCDCAILFFILSFFGWCAETALFLFRWNVLADRGFLTLPFCTIYGTAVLAEHFLLGTPQTGRLSPLWKKAALLPPARKAAARLGVLALYFVLASFPPAAAELAVGTLFTDLLHVRLWNYSYQKFQLFGSVSLSFTLLWGGLITLGMAVVWEPARKTVRDLSYPFRRAAAVSLSLCTAADFAFNLIFLLTTGKRFSLF